MPEFQDFYYTSSDGKNNIHALRCQPDSAPRAVVQISHGIAGHINRYTEFMSFLAENGFVAVGNDHLGHGKTIAHPDDIGFFAEKDGWKLVVADMDKLHDIMSTEYPDIPYIFLGHSMGSFLTRTYLIDHPDKYDAAILSGTGHQLKPVIYGGYALAELTVKAEGPRSIGYTLYDIAFGAYNNGYKNRRTKFDWISSDYHAVDRYIADPLCGFICTVSLYRDMLWGLTYITNQKNIDRMNKEKPVYFFSGSADPVGENGKGVSRAYKAFCKAGLHDVLMRIYPDGRHEMLNEVNRADVYRDVVNWINEKI